MWRILTALFLLAFMVLFAQFVQEKGYSILIVGPITFFLIVAISLIRQAVSLKNAELRSGVVEVVPRKGMNDTFEEKLTYTEVREVFTLSTVPNIQLWIAGRWPLKIRVFNKNGKCVEMLDSFNPLIWPLRISRSDSEENMKLYLWQYRSDEAEAVLESTSPWNKTYYVNEGWSYRAFRINTKDMVLDLTIVRV